MGTQPFDDPRGHQSELLAYQAEKAVQRGDAQRATMLYLQAAELEEQVALSVPDTSPRVRGALAVSATALWYKAGQYLRAEALACRFLGGEPVAPDAMEELRRLLARCWRESEVEAAKAPGELWIPLEVTLDGGRVRPGLAPASVVRERQQLTSTMLTRVAELQLGEPLRNRGEARGRVHKVARIFEAPAQVHSYGVQLYVVSSQGQMKGTPGSGRLSAASVVNQFLELAETAQRNPRDLAKLVKDGAYQRAFLLGFRDLAPDGERVASVSFSGAGCLVRAPSVTFEPMDRTAITAALEEGGEHGTMEVEGILKHLKLTGKSPSIAIEVEGRLMTFRIARGKFDETIGPKVNRRVKIIAQRADMMGDEPLAREILLSGS